MCVEAGERALRGEDDFLVGKAGMGRCFAGVTGLGRIGRLKPLVDCRNRMCAAGFCEQTRKSGRVEPS